VGHAGDADELLEVTGDEGWTVVGDDAWMFARELFAGALENGFHVDFRHFLADFKVYQVTTAAIEDGAEEVKGAGDVQMADINVPVFMGLERLHEAGAFLGGLGRLAGQQSGVFEDAVDAGRAAGGHIGVEHHEGQLPIAFERVLPGEGADAFLLLVGEPVIARHPGVMFVDFAEACFPVVELAGADADPGHKAVHGDLRFVRPGANEIDEIVADIVGHPAAFQISPSSFFKRVWASISSAMTSFLRVSLASSCWILTSLASSSALALRPFSKTVWPFSKSSFCQR